MKHLNPFNLKGRTALITGSSRGIGRVLALALAEAGANVAVHASAGGARLEETVGQVAAKGVLSAGIAVDLSVAGAAAAIYTKALDALGQPDILICNASVQYPEHWLEVSAERFEQQMRVNLQSTFELIQLAAPAMAEQGWGRIVTVGSVQETRPHPQMVAYAASKCAQTSLVRSFAARLAGQGVTVNNIAPGVIDTDRNSGRLADETYRKLVLSKIPSGRIGAPEDCVGAVLLLCSEAGSYITGQSLYIDGGMSL